MADTPKIRSFSEIYEQLVTDFLSRSQSANDLNPGSILDSLISAVAQVGFNITADTIQQLTSLSIDRANGETLKRIANDKNVPIFSSQPSTGFVTISDTAFAKLEDKIYAGSPPPVPGQSYVYVSDASLFPADGSVYLGRGTSSVEGPLKYVSITPLPSPASPEYYQVNFDVGVYTSKFHNSGESVLLAQGGDRVIPTGTVVKTQQTSSSAAISFTTTQPSKILDGEVSVSSVPVIAQEPGTSSNVSKGSIIEISGVPFDGIVTNELSFTNGRNDDTDDVLRERIKAYEQSKTKGTEAAIKQAVMDASAADEMKRIKSSEVIRKTGTEQILVIDDGNGYEPISAGVGLETLIDEALGGEKEFQLLNPMVERATVRTIKQGPYALLGGETLTVSITGLSVQDHIFQASDFKTVGQASAFEVVASINAAQPPLPYYARTVDAGTRVALTPKDRNEIKITDCTANTALTFPTTVVYTARLYKNDLASYQDGLTAGVETLNQSDWDSGIADGTTIKYSVDGTEAVQVAITDQDFQVYGASLNVSKTQALDIWAKVLNDRLPGVVTTVSGQTLRLESRSGASSDASLEIMASVPTGADLYSFMFDTSNLSDQGRTSDYVLNSKTGQLEWASTFSINDKLAAGSQFTRAKFETSSASAINLGPTDLDIFLIVDGAAQYITHSMSLSDPLRSLTITGDLMTLVCQNATGGGAFTNVHEGDWVILWKEYADVSFLSSVNLGAFRVRNKKQTNVANDTIEFYNPGGVSDGLFSIGSTSRVVFARSEKPVQKAIFQTSIILTNDLLRDAFNNNFTGVNSTVIGEKVRVESKTIDADISELFIAVATQNLVNLGLTTGKYSAVTSHNGNVSSTKEFGLGIPNFKVLDVDAPITGSSFGVVAYENADGNENEFAQHVNYDAAATGKNPVYQSTNKDVAEFITDYAGGVVTVQDKFLTPRYTADDKIILRQGLMFDANDQLTAVLDQDIIGKAFVLPISRKLQITSVASPSVFDANDAQTAIDLNNINTFKSFNFNNFKAWSQAKGVVQGLNIKYKDFGPSGSKNGVSFRYPSQPDAELSHTFENDLINKTIISLSSGAPRSGNWDGTTTLTVGTPIQVDNIETAAITYNTITGSTDPQFNLSTVQVGDIVNIGALSGFLGQNTGSFKVVGPITASSFSVQAPVGTLTADNVAVSAIVYPNPGTETLPFGSGRATFTTATNHNLKIGQIVGIYGANNNYNRTYTVQAVTPTTFEATPVGISGSSVTAIQRTTNVSTITLNLGHGLVTGNTVKVSNITAAAGFNGTFVITAHTTTSVTYANAGVDVPFTGATGRADKQATVFGNLARALQDVSNLQFFPNSATQATIKTYIDTNLSDIFECTTTVPATAVDQNSQYHIGSSYYVTGGSVTIEQVYGTFDRWIYLPAAAAFKKGAVIKVTLAADISDLSHDICPLSGPFIGPVPLTVLEVDGSRIRVKVARKAWSIESSVIVAMTNYVVIQDTVALGSSESFIGTYTEAVLPGPGTFTLKKPLNDLALGDEIYVICCNSEQLVRFTNKLAVSGISNLAEISTSELDYNFQIRTNTFGSGGSVQVSGGTANKISAAITGSGAVTGESSGVDIAKDLRKPFSPRSWIKIENQTSQFKQIGMNVLTTIKVKSATQSVITVANATFQTARSLVFDASTRVKFEKHGTYICMRQIAGAALGINSSAMEGDWLYTDSTGNAMSTGNTGIFRILRIFDNSVWFENINFVEEATSVITSTNLKILSYDSVMPGDKVKISGTTLGSQNVGSFTVAGPLTTITPTSLKVTATLANTLAPALVVTSAQQSGTLVTLFSAGHNVPGGGGTVVVSGLSGAFAAYNGQYEANYVNANEFSYTVGASAIIGATAQTAAFQLVVPVPLGNQFNNFNIEEEKPLSLIKQIHLTGPSSNSANLSYIGFENKSLVSRFSSSLGAVVTSLSKLGMDETIKVGIDAYRYHKGLIKEAYRIVYGDPSDSANYPGVRAAGTDIDIVPPIIRRISVSLNVRIKTGVPVTEVIDAVKQSATGYVNSLNVGQVVSVSALISACQSVDGLISVEVISTNPIQTSGIIPVTSIEIAKIVNSTTDVSVTIVGG